MQTPGGDGIIGSRFADDQSIDVASVIASSAKQIRNLKSMHSVFPDLQLTNDIGRTAIKRRAVVRIAIAGWLHGWSNIGELRDIREFLVGTVPDNMLHKN